MAKKYGLAAALIFMLFVNGFACRFTIRDIGYSRLNVETYLVRFSSDTLQNRALYRAFKKIAYDNSVSSNLNYKIFHKTDQLPLLECSNSRGDIILEQKISSAKDVRDFYNTLLFSPLQRAMYRDFDNAFAYIAAFYDENDKQIDIAVDKALMQFKKIAPDLDKEITENIIKIIIHTDKRAQEAALLRAMDIDPDEKKALVAVFYGRGRLADKVLVGEEITAANLLNRLVMLGTDCECGIDLSPLLQNAIPFNWDKKMSKDVAAMLGFDVDNPLILIEMGQILSKEPLETGKSNFSFAPQTIDLDKALGKNKKKEDIKPVPNTAIRTSLIIFTVLVFIIISAGLVIFFRRER